MSIMQEECKRKDVRRTLSVIVLYLAGLGIIVYGAACWSPWFALAGLLPVFANLSIIAHAIRADKDDRETLTAGSKLLKSPKDHIAFGQLVSLVVGVPLLHTGYKTSLGPFALGFILVAGNFCIALLMLCWKPHLLHKSPTQ